MSIINKEYTIQLPPVLDILGRGLERYLKTYIWGLVVLAVQFGQFTPHLEALNLLTLFISVLDYLDWKIFMKELIFLHILCVSQALCPDWRQACAQGYIES